LAQLRSVMEKVTRFPLELVMNLEFRLGIHHDPPAGRANCAHLKMSKYGYRAAGAGTLRGTATSFRDRYRLALQQPALIGLLSLVTEMKLQGS
jgi:hypothetical protein